MKEKFEFEIPKGGQEIFLPLGNREEIIKKLKNKFSNIDYSDKSWGILIEQDFSIEFNTGSDEIVNTIMLHIRGGGNVIKIVQTICEILDGHALDISYTRYIDFDFSEKTEESWGDFQKYRNQVIKLYEEDK